MTSQPKKILLIGSPGSGKSTVAPLLAKKYGVKVVHLDRDYHSKSRWSEDIFEKKVEWREYIKTLVGRSEWLMDGNYTSTLDIRIPAADLVLFLDYPTYVSLWGVLKRRAQLRSKPRKDMPSDWDEKISMDFLRKTLGFKKTHRPRIMKLLAKETTDKYLVLRTRKELIHFTETIKKT